MKRIIFTSVLLSFLTCVSAQELNLVPKRIILNLTPNPTHEMAVSWRTDSLPEDPMVQYHVASNWVDFEDKVKSVIAETIVFKSDSVNNAYYHKAIIRNLDPNTPYVYRVGSGNIWSPWKQFKTASGDKNPFEFVWFGDAQHDLESHVSKVFQKALMTSPDASFWLFSGDLVDEPFRDYQMNEAFNAWGFIPSVIPQVLAAGNHEYTDVIIDGREVEYLEKNWLVHFNQPHNGIPNLKGTSFHFDYQGVKFIVLNGNEKLNEQAVWLNQVLEKNENKWTIVVVHQPFYSMGKKRNQRKIHDAFLSILDKYNVDLVLQGHDHVYSRTKKMFNDKVVNDGDKGTVYLISQCGTDAYTIDSPNLSINEKVENKIQLFQIISVNGSSLQYKSVTVTGEIFDEFEIVKTD